MNKKVKVDSHETKSTSENKKTAHKKKAEEPETHTEVILAEKEEHLPVPVETTQTPDIAPTEKAEPVKTEQAVEQTQKTSPELPAMEDEKVTTAESNNKEAISKEKLIDRQLELLWANGRKQLLVDTPQAKHSSSPK